MIDHLIVRAEAEDDLRDAYDWYEIKRRGLGESFLLSVKAGIAFIRRHPEASARVSPRLRRHLIKRFPYGIFYLVENYTLIVTAILHASRDPSGWRHT